MKGYLNALALLALGAAASAAAEEAVVVTAKRFPERALEAPVGMTVIGRDRIDAGTARTLPELLAQEAGLHIRDTTSSPDPQVDLRGFGMTGDQNTLVLLDGQRLNEIELTSIRWSSIPLESVERVEILRGTGSVLYGGGASGGTINIITRRVRPGERSATVGLSAGSLGALGWYLGGSSSGQRAGVSLRASESSTNNFRSNNRMEQRNLGGEFRAFLDRGEAHFRFDVEDQALQLPGPRSAALPAQLSDDPRGTATPRDFANRDGLRASLGGTLDLGFAELAAEIGMRESARTSSQKDYSGGGFDTYVDTRTRVWSLTPRLRIVHGLLGLKHQLVTGMDLEDWDYRQLRARSLEALGAPLADIDSSQMNLSLYAQNHTALGERTKLTLGFRQQRMEMSAHDRRNAAAYARGRKVSTPVAWDAGLRHQINSTIAVYGRLGRSFRLSTVDESYAQFGGPLGDAIVSLLEPQTSRDQEAGLEFRGDGRRLRVSAYQIDLQNEIHFYSPTFSNINLPPTRREGLELEGRIALGARLAIEGGASAVRARFRDGFLGGVNLRGKTVPLVPRDLASLGFAWTPRDGTRVALSSKRVGKQRYDNDQANTYPAHMTSYSVTDLRLSQELGSARLSLQVHNLFNKRYFSYAIRNGAGTSFNAYPQAGRTLLFTAEMRFR